jgi:hypothetical protein
LNIVHSTERLLTFKPRASNTIVKDSDGVPFALETAPTIERQSDILSYRTALPDDQSADRLFDVQESSAARKSRVRKNRINKFSLLAQRALGMEVTII